jgi:acetylornithine deacetylase/succinyl-diaminopimelate desuccinylase-like protein
MDGIHADFPPRTVPAYCRLLLHRFYLPEEDEAELREAVTCGRARSSVLDVQMRVLYRFPSLCADEESPYRRRMRQSYAAARGLKSVEFVRRIARGPADHAVAARLVGSNWVSVDASRLSALYPPHECQAHHADERVRISDLKTATKQLIHYLSDLS